MPVKPIPEDYHNVTPYISVEGAGRFMDFLKQVFEAEEVMRMTGPNGDGIMHGEVRIGDSRIMTSDACDRMGPTPAALYVYVPDVDAAYQRAIQAGCESIMEPADQFYGDRSSGVKDRFGNTWFIAKHVEDVTPDEMQRRVAAMGEKAGA